MRYQIPLNGKVFEVEVECGTAAIIDEYEADCAVPDAPAAAGEVITSPLPGSIFELNVREGDTVRTGQLLLVIEAMKMENEVVATCNGVVRQILVSPGETVEMGKPLLVLG